MSTTLAPSVRHYDSKGRKFMSICEQAYDKAGFTEEEAQCTNDTPGLATLLAEFFARARLRQDFANEEVPSTFGYHSGYQAPKPMVEQVAILKAHFPELANATWSQEAEQKAEQKALHATEHGLGPEGPFAIVPWQLIGKTYGEALERVLEVLGKTRDGRFIDYCRGKHGSKYLRESAKKIEAFERIASEQEGHNVLVIAGQFGTRHRGRSVRRACAVMDATEFGLGAFEVAIMLLTHPERLAHDDDDLWIDCAGDEYSSEAGGQFLGAPIFYFRDGELRLGASEVSYPCGHYGSVSGFSVSQ